MVQGKTRRIGVGRVEWAVALLRHVELRAEDEAKALDRAEPRAELLLVEARGSCRPLELGERLQLPVDEGGADESGVVLVRRVVLRVRGGEEPVQRRLVGVERLAQLLGQCREDVAFRVRKLDPVRAVPACSDPSPSHH